MSLSTFLDFSTTPGSNIDVNGTGILGSSPVNNFDNALRELMAILRRDLDAGTIYATKTGTYTAVANDNNAFIRATGALALSLTAAATLGADWHLFIYAEGGDVTVDPNGSETVNGATTAVIPQGFDGFLICDGSGFRLVSAGYQGANGQCQLTLSGGNLLLSRKNGKLLTINGVHQSVPSAGITLAATGTTPGTLYYIYAYMNAGTMTLEASTTGHSTDSATGVEIKTGDSTRTLVGMARPITGPAWADSIGQRFVRSWFSRKPEAMRKAFTAVRSTSSLSFTEVNSEIRCEWLQWADEVPTAHIQGTATNNTASILVLTAIGWDGTADANTSNSIGSATGIAYNCSTSGPKEGLAEGYHYATLMGVVASASTGSWTGGIAGIFTSLSVRVGQ